MTRPDEQFPNPSPDDLDPHSGGENIDLGVPNSAIDAGLVAAFGPIQSSGAIGNRYRVLYESGTVVAKRYRLIKPIGEGGMGTVWYAEQTAPVKRKVAVKLVKPGLDSQSVLARFDAERQALALMDHPNIAKVYDGGITDLGHPFFVMELVRGTAITAWCDQNRIGLRERLQLLIPVCQAIHHAHQKGIIHRDIKPSNVMVAMFDGKPVPKVIDFGVAKTFGPTLTEQSLHTDYGAVVGTAEYMSPEQAQLNNVDIDTRSDVYSLGVLMYELLAGSTPFSRAELAERGWHEVLRVIREVDPLRPSVKLSTSKLRASIAAHRSIEPLALGRLLKSELDWVVMKSLEKDRSRRYESAAAFASDLQRYLVNQPVEAHPPKASYRFQKFVKRNRWQVFAAGLLLASLVVGIIGTAWGLVRAESQRKIALQARQVAETNFRMALDSVNTYLAKVSASEELKAAGSERLRRDLLRAAQDFYARFAEQYPSQPSRRRDLIEAHQQLGHIQFEMGNYADSISRLQQALKILEDEEPSNESSRLKIALVTSLASSQSMAGQASEAANSLQHGINSWSTTNAGEDPSIGDLIELADLHVRLGRFLIGLERSEEEARAFDLASDLAERAKNLNMPLGEGGHLLIQVHNYLGSARERQGRMKEARYHFNEVIRIGKSEIDLHPDDEAPAIDVARGWLSLGTLEMHEGNLTAAREALLQALPQLERLARQHPTVIAHVDARAMCHLLLGNVELSGGNFQAATDAWMLARDLYQNMVEDHAEAIEFRLTLAKVLANLGHATFQLNRPADAQSFTRESLDQLDWLVKEFPENLEYASIQASISSNLAALLIGTKQAEAALQVLERSIRAHEHCVKLQPDVPDLRLYLAQARLNAGTACSNLLQPDAGLGYLDQAIRELGDLTNGADVLPAFHDSLARAHEARGGLHYAYGQQPTAESDFRTVVTLRQQAVSRLASSINLANLGWAWLDIANLKRDSPQPDEALPLLETAETQFRAAESVADPVDAKWVVDVAHSRAKVFSRTGQFNKAQAVLREARSHATDDWLQILSVADALVLVGLKEWTAASALLETLPPVEDFSDARNLVELAGVWAMMAIGADADDPWFHPESSHAGFTAADSRRKVLECLEQAYQNGFRNLPYFDAIPSLSQMSTEPVFQDFRSRLIVESLRK